MQLQCLKEKVAALEKEAEFKLQEPGGTIINQVSLLSKLNGIEWEQWENEKRGDMEIKQEKGDMDIRQEGGEIDIRQEKEEKE